MKAPEHSDTPAPGAFNTTHWSVVSLAGKKQSPQSSAALEKLCQTYWRPLYAFVRRKGYSAEDAEDLTQEFFARVLERDAFEGVDPAKGKFRTFLLAALTHFLSNRRDYERAAKRGGGKRIFSLEEIQEERAAGMEPASELSPDKVYDARWATVILEQALKQLRHEFEEEGKAAIFEALKAFLTEEPPEGAYGRVAERLGSSSQSIAVMVYRLRGRYRALVRAEVAHTVCSPLNVDEEMRHLLEALTP